MIGQTELRINPSEEHQNNFLDYLQKQQITDIKHYCFDLNAFRSTHSSTAQDVIKHPQKYYKLIKNHLDKANHHEEPSKKYEIKKDHYSISFSGNLGSNFVTPRGLGSKFANQLVGIQGIITKMDVTKYYLEKSVHWCPQTKGYQYKQYPDNYAIDKDFEPGQSRFIMTKDKNENPLEFQYGLSSFRDIQKVVIQQLPQNAPPGLLPMSIDVILQGELVTSVKPGDRVQMIGIYKIVPGVFSKERGIFRPIFICLSVEPLYKVTMAKNISVRAPVPQNELYSLFSRSIAPSLSGHQYIKKAVLLMLLGGVEKNLENGTHLRGDINILMVGDPGTGKSQILRWVLCTVDLGIGTTGSGASGVGLTAAVVSDRETGEKSLQAGAMVLADRGYVCIDQFDKMNETDRVAVHEVMEQQTVTIAKAGIHCSLNARCSVVAAANPIYGEYQDDLPPTKNINMPDSLLSRFDLIFIIKDEKTTEKDKKISQRVARNHRLAPCVNEVFNQYQQDDDFIIQPVQSQRQDEQGPYEKSNVFKSDAKVQILTQSFLKNYINHCKKNCTPILTDQSIELLSNMWALLRQKDFNADNKSKVLPITIRTHQTLIRLSTAYAKLRLSTTIQPSDCIEAFKLLVFSLDGAEDSLDTELMDICKTLHIDPKNKLKSQVDRKSLKKSQVPSSTTNQVKFSQKSAEKSKIINEKEDDSVKKVTKGVQKMQLSHKEKKKAAQQVDKMVTQKPVNQTLHELSKIVYKKAADLKRKRRGGFANYGDLLVAVEKQMNEQKLQEVLKHMQEEGTLMFNQKEGKVFLL